MSDIKQTKAAAYLEAVNAAMMLESENRRLKERIKELEDALIAIRAINDLIPDAGEIGEEKS